nr:6K2 [Algerian watermelon mosaic virus]
GEHGKKHITEQLGLKGIWNKSLMCKDALVSGLVFLGGLVILWQNYKEKMLSKVYHQ